MNEKQLPPSNLEAEQSVIGSIAFDGSKLDLVCEVLSPDDFYFDVNRIIYQECLNIRKGGGEVDVITLCSQLQAVGKLEDVGGPSHIAEVMSSVPHGAHALLHARLIVDCARRRKAMVIGRTLFEKASDPATNDVELIEETLSTVMKLNEMLTKTKARARTLSDHVDEVVNTYEQGETPTVWWGIPDIDQLIGGVMPGELVIIGGRPSHGKSLVGLQWLEEASAKGIPGLMISEEMSAASLATRALNSITVIPSSEWKSSIERVRFDVRDHFSQRSPILIEEKCSKIASAERAIARAVQSHGIRICAVDYAQLLSGDGDTKEQRVADVSTRLKSCAMRHDIVVLLLAQLNRGIEGRDNPSPQLADLRDSGGLENDADVALFPFWPWKFDSDYENRDEYRVYVRKNRNRGIGNAVVEMRINAARQRLEPASIPDDWDRR